MLRKSLPAGCASRNGWRVNQHSTTFTQNPSADNLGFFVVVSSDG